MKNKYVIYKSVRGGLRGPRLRLHMFINGVPDLSIIFSPNETASIYYMIKKHVDAEKAYREQLKKEKHSKPHFPKGKAFSNS